MSRTSHSRFTSTACRRSATNWKRFTSSSPRRKTRRLAPDVPLGGQPSAPRAIAEAVVGGVTLDAPDALILGDHHGGYAWPAAPDP
jgi:hypothetical protein